MNVLRRRQGIAPRHLAFGAEPRREGASQYASLMGGLGDWLGRVMIGLGALLLAGVVGILAIALAVLLVNAMS